MAGLVERGEAPRAGTVEPNAVRDDVGFKPGGAELVGDISRGRVVLGRAGDVGRGDDNGYRGDNRDSRGGDNGFRGDGGYRGDDNRYRGGDNNGYRGGDGGYRGGDD